jgi:4-hydroxy-4-methyl-2-oxoglutarate aldolase
MSTMSEADLAARWAALSSATVHEAARKIGALPSTIKPLAHHQKVAGPAFPVTSPAGDNLWLHRAIYAARPGDVLVVDTSGGVEFGYWGEVMAVAARQRGIAGLVINGGVRDSQRMVELGFPVFSSAVCIRGTGKDPDGAGQCGGAIVLGGIDVHAGDWVLGDADGVVVIPAARVAGIVAEAEHRDAMEREIFLRLKSGESTIAIYDLPAEART